MNVVSFYRFLDISDPDTLARKLRSQCAGHRILGTVLVASEGVNGTLAGSADAVESVIRWLETSLDLDIPLDLRKTVSRESPFRRMRVKVKREIVALGRPDLRPQDGTAVHIPPGRWNRLIDDPQTLLVDARNHYEVEVGRFPGAMDPGTDNFREFAGYARQLDDVPRDRPVAMYCTGGIRCEKASALLLELGFRSVYQLEGGILNYLATVPETDSRWLGECFVFDQRIAVDRDLAEGQYVQCHACRRPLSAAELGSPHYREGVSCPNCIHELDADRRRSLEERRRQIRLSRERGESHIGAMLEPEANADDGAR